MSAAFNRLWDSINSGEMTEQMRADAEELAMKYVVSGMLRHPLAEEGWTEIGWSTVEKRRDIVISDYKKRGIFDEALKVLIKTKDVGLYLNHLLPVYNTLVYVAYSDFWLSRTTETGEPEFPYYNIIIGMRWWEGHGVWAVTKVEGGKRIVDYQKGTRIALPPTKELIMKEYKEIQERRTNEADEC